MDILPAAFSVNQAAKYLGISRTGLYRLLNSGDLKTTRIGARTLIRRVDADAFLEQASTGSITPRSAEKSRPGGNVEGILA